MKMGLMKKSVLTVFAIGMLAISLALFGCGGSGADGNSGGDAAAYNLDMKSPEKQAMSEDRASLDVLKETKTDYLKSNNYFLDSEESNYTYKDLRDHIGVDASEYRYDDAKEAECYIWYAGEGDVSALSAWFIDGKLDMAGYINL